MVFSSLQFLFLFFPIVFIGYALIKPQYANTWLCIASIVFYGVEGRQHLPLLLSIIGLSYFAGLLMGNLTNSNAKKLLLMSSLFLMLAAMGYYKYWNFLMQNLNAIFHTTYTTTAVALPIGISFFTFQAISYLVDTYRGETPLKNLIDLALYIAFFPQLIAGPIVRFHDIREYLHLEHREMHFDGISEGVWRFCEGLAKKVLLANNLGGLADIVFSVRDVSQCSVMYVWLGAVAYTLQIYFDFSGYSDMAIGLGKVFGFEFRENFRHPYIAVSIQDFWRRWHISLSSFFRDYVYIPLGGNRCSFGRWMFHMMVVWLLTGLWHGAAWTYILWGCVYGIALIAERYFLGEPGEAKIPLRNALGHIYTMVLVILLWVVFRSNSIVYASLLVKAMFGIGVSAFVDNAFWFQVKNYAVLLAVSLLCCVPWSLSEHEWLPVKWSTVLQTLFLSICTIASISYVYMSGYNPFLYFMF